MSLRRLTEACFIPWSFWGVVSDTRSVHFFSTLGLHIHVLYEQHSCVHHGFCLFRDWHCDHRIFQSMIIIRCIIPVFIMFASTFKSTHWLVPGYCLGQISCLERSVAMTAPEPKQRDSSLTKIGVIQVSCSCGKWSSTDTDDHKPLPPSTTRNLVLYS